MNIVGFVDFYVEIRIEESRDMLALMLNALGGGSVGEGMVLAKYYAFVDDCGVVKEADNAFYLFRDPMGLQPVFYTIVGSRVVFASAIRALFSYPGVEAVLDINGLGELIALGPARYEHSGVFKGIHALPPGYFLRIERGQPLNSIKGEKYWDFPARFHVHSEEETIANVRKLLRDAILSRLRVDDSICSLLSGGLDSSIVTAVIAEEYRKTGRPLRTFSFDFTNSAEHFKSNAFQPDRDRPWIDKMVEFCKTSHEYLECGPEDLVNSLYAAVDARDLPGMADIDASLLYFCSKIPKDIGTVFTGECADEIFGGYPWFHKELEEGTNQFPWSRDFETRRAFLKDEWIEALKLEAVSAEYCQKTISEAPLEESLSRRGYLTLKWFMPTLIERMGRMGGYSGLKAEVPFADVKLMEYVWNVPWALKCKNGTVKYVLREAAKGIVPEEVLLRKKSPFPKTYDPAYTALLAERLTDVLSNPAAPVRMFVDLKKAEKFITAMIKEPNVSRPWYGQLMAGPQMMAYVLQLDYWLRKYRVSCRF